MKKDKKREQEIMEAVGKVTTEEERKYFRAISALSSIVGDGATDIGKLVDGIFNRFKNRSTDSPVTSEISKKDILRQLEQDGLVDLLIAERYIKENDDGSYSVYGQGLASGWAMHVTLIGDIPVSEAVTRELLTQVVSNTLDRNFDYEELFTPKEVVQIKDAIYAMMQKPSTVH